MILHRLPALLTLLALAGAGAARAADPPPPPARAADPSQVLPNSGCEPVRTVYRSDERYERAVASNPPCDHELFEIREGDVHHVAASGDQPARYVVWLRGRFGVHQPNQRLALLTEGGSYFVPGLGLYAVTLYASRFLAVRTWRPDEIYAEIADDGLAGDYPLALVYDQPPPPDYPHFLLGSNYVRLRFGGAP